LAVRDENTPLVPFTEVTETHSPPYREGKKLNTENTEPGDHRTQKPDRLTVDKSRERQTQRRGVHRDRKRGRIRRQGEVRPFAFVPGKGDA